MTQAGQPRQPPQGDPSLPGESSRLLPRRPSTSSHSSLSPHRPSSLIEVSRRLTDRDRRLALLLVEHRALTTAQIAAAAFTHVGTARNRLRQLRELGFLDAFTHRPRTGPSVGRRVTCWVPGLLAARYVALADGHPVPTPRAVRQAQDRTLANPQLDHLLGVNQFFTDLIAHSRNHPEGRLVRWWSAERTANAYAGRIHPDGHGIWRRHSSSSFARGGGDGDDRDSAHQLHPGGSVSAARDGYADTGPGHLAAFWLEHDMGTEPLTRVIAKLDAYQRLQDAGGPTLPVLFRLPTRRRQDNLHPLLSDRAARLGVTVATGVFRRGRAVLERDEPALWRLPDESLDVELPPCL